MAGPTLGQQLTELKGELKVVAEEFTTFKAVAELSKKVSDDKLTEVDALAKRIQEKLADTAIKLAAIEERIKSLEKSTDKTSDRRWQLAPILISAGSAVVSLVSVVVAVVVASKK